MKREPTQDTLTLIITIIVLISIYIGSVIFSFTEEG